MNIGLPELLIVLVVLLVPIALVVTLIVVIGARRKHPTAGMFNDPPAPPA